MESLYFDFPSGRVHVLRMGNGPELMIALHGFGDRARMFGVLEEALATPYTIFAIDWPFHGQTEWHKPDFTKADMLAIVAAILKQEGKSKFSLMGFSFGARLAQAMLPELAPQINKLYLLSPDGIKTRGMSAAVKFPMFIRRLLYRMLQRPDWFINLLTLGRKIKIVNPLIYHFLTNNLNKPERFKRTFGCWLSLNQFYLRRRTIKKILRESGIPTEIFFGSKDAMIRFETLKKMTEGLPNVRLSVLDEGHRLIGERLRDELSANYRT